MNASKTIKRRASLGGSGGGGGTSPGAVVGGDLTGTTAAATVTGIRGKEVLNAPSTSADQLKYNSSTGKLVWRAGIEYFATGILAAGVAHLLNETVVIYPGTTPAEAGTYKVTANDGTTWPTDYTQVSDATNTASEVGVLDTDNHFDGTQVEAVLDEIAEGNVRGIKFPLLIATNVVDTVSAVKYRSGEFLVSITKGTQTYKAVLSVAHDTAIVNVTEHSIDAGPGIAVPPFTFDASITGGGANLNILVTASEAGWSCHIRRMALMEA